MDYDGARNRFFGYLHKDKKIITTLNYTGPCKTWALVEVSSTFRTRCAMVNIFL